MKWYVEITLNLGYKDVVIYVLGFATFQLSDVGKPSNLADQVFPHFYNSLFLKLGLKPKECFNQHYWPPTNRMTINPGEILDRAPFHSL